MTKDQTILITKQRKNLQSLCNRVLSSWSFKTLKTWEDVYAITGVPLTDPKTGTLIYAELKTYLDKLKTDFEERANNSQSESVGHGVGLSGGKSIEEVSHDNVQTSNVDVSVEIQNNQDYGLPVNTNHKAFLFWFQKKAVKEILDAFLGFDVSSCKDIEALKAKFQLHKHKANAKRGMQLLAATGTGKTYMTAAVVRYLFDIGFHEDICMGHVSYLYVTRATIVEQTERVFRNTFGLSQKQGVEVLNIEQLRSRAGGVWIKDELIIEDGNEKRVWKWRAAISPCVILWDESQALKNEGSIQHEIASAYNNIKANTYQLFVSATPFTRVCEAKCFCVSTRKHISDQLGLGTVTSLSNETWPTYSASITPDPTEYNEAAVERLTKDLEQFIVRVRGIRPQFDATNRIEMIQFSTQEERDYYNQAWERYLAEKAKLEAEGIDSPGATGNSRFQILVQFLKFRMAAEYCRRHQLAKRMYDAVTKGNKAAVCALNFKHTIIGIVKILNEDYGVPRDSISLVWGGGQTGLTKKQKQRASLKAKADKLAEVGESIDELLETLDLDDVEDRVLEDLPEHLRLGSQSREERQKEIDKFQSGKSLYCLFSFRAGGVGLSLHHTDELCTEYNTKAPGFDEWEKKIAKVNLNLPENKKIRKGKIRRKDNGYAVEEDLPYVYTRPRICFLAPTYSAIELVQGLGRCPRLTSLSDTEQILLFYSGTIEQEVSIVVSKKLRCLSKVVRQREKWADVIMEGAKASSHDDGEPEAVVAGTDYDSLGAEIGEDE